MILYALFHFFLNKRIILLERIMIVNFAVIGVAFGIFVSYSDFWGGKEIICFMMMMIYVGYLTIYRPYITVLILSSCFFAFYNVLLTYEGGLTFKPKEVVINGVTHIITSGDTANYLTYLASLITICIAMYHGRLKEANESRRIYRLFGQTAEALAAAIDTKDKYTHGHSQRVADYSLKIARAAGKSEEDCQQVYYAALLHDVGKIGVPDQIINKEGALTDEEFAEIKKHPVHGNNILSRINESPYLSIGAHYHHERYDGRGYPTGLKGEDIPEIARIIAVADAYDAMTSKRSYREPLPQQKVREEVYKGIGTQFDPEFARLMINLMDEDTSYLMQESDQQTEDGVSTRLTCGNLYNDCTEGTQLVDQILQMRFYSKAQDGFSERESIPSLVLFDSLDKRIHLSERGKKDFMYYEYARIRMDGEVVSEGTRNVEKKRIKGANAEGEADAYTKERGVRYDVRAFRIEDHVQIRIESKYQTVEITLALPDSVRFSYLAITGSHCEIFNIKMKQEEDAVAEDQITRIAPRISYIDDAPAGDVPNVQINGWREKTTEGILLKEGKTIISFHSRSLPMAWLIWHCPFILLFTSEDASVSGDQFREFGVIRLDGETWMSDEHAENIIETDQTKDFKGWNEWREKNKEGIDITVTLTRNGNTIITETENLGLSLHTTTIVRDETENIYAAITGDICAITDIHVTNSMS
ncbi:MAG: HD-GYP domain-containing protein [Lachnospiraceae bacterium]|nr:HD-GYP domain-containing protein [Lachnospiraceae bacterium]